MKIVPFEKSTHLEILDKWLRLHDSEPSHVPAIGLVAVSDKVKLPIAMGFLRKMEGGGCILDQLTTNPRCRAETRDEALNVLVDGLILLAKENNFGGILAWSREPNILIRAKKFGFITMPHMLILLPLDKAPIDNQ